MRISAISGDKDAGSNGDFGLLPDGWYPVKISSAEVKQTKAGTGSYISVRYDITSGPGQNRVVFAIYNIDNPNPTAEKIGREQLSRVAGCCGIKELTDTDQLLGKHLELKLTTRKSEEYGDKNEVKDAREGKVPNTESAALPSFASDCPFAIPDDLRVLF